MNNFKITITNPVNGTSTISYTNKNTYHMIYRAIQRVDDKTVVEEMPDSQHDYLVLVSEDAKE